MLVLSRKIGETLMIGDDIKITINRIAGNRVTVGVEAPHHVKIVRGELERFIAEPNSNTGAAVTATPEQTPMLAHRHA
jgi:carbon storage regulator